MVDKSKAQSMIDSWKTSSNNGISEKESKDFLSLFDIPFPDEKTFTSFDEARNFIDETGFPVVLKGSGKDFAHKSEQNLIRLGISSHEQFADNFNELLTKCGEVLISRQIAGFRELVVGMTRDNQFGPCVMFGFGGVLTEAIKDVVFRVAPLDVNEACVMISDINSFDMLKNFRSQKSVNIRKLAEIIVNVGEIGVSFPEIQEIDINPLIIQPGGDIVAVDALVVYK